MKKKISVSLTFWWILSIAFMFILGISGTIWDESDWIFIFLVVGIIILNIKLNKILELLSKKKK